MVRTPSFKDLTSAILNPAGHRDKEEALGRTALASECTLCDGARRDLVRGTGTTFDVAKAVHWDGSAKNERSSCRSLGRVRRRRFRWISSGRCGGKLRKGMGM